MSHSDRHASFRRRTRSVSLGLRMAVFVVAGILAAEFLDPDLDLGGLREEVVRNIAAVSAITTSVPRNDVNALAQALDDERAKLDVRAVELDQREAALALRVAEEVRRENRKTLFVILGTAFVLLILILLNFYFDLRRDPHAPDLGTNDEPTPPKHDDPQKGDFVTRL